MKTFVLCLMTLLAVLLELLCGNLGLMPGIIIFNAIYFAVAYHGNSGAAAAVVSGLLLDGIYGRPFPVMTLVALTTTGGALLLLNRNNRQLPFLVVCGLIAGTVNALSQIVCAWYWQTPLPGPDWWTILIFYSVFGAFYLPILSLLLDFFAAKCNLPGMLKDNDELDYLRRKPKY